MLRHFWIVGFNRSLLLLSSSTQAISSYDSEKLLILSLQERNVVGFFIYHFYFRLTLISDGPQWTQSDIWQE